MRNVLLALAAVLTAGFAQPSLAQKSVSAMVDDGAIAAEIKAGLLDNRNTSSMAINVESYQGVVQLSGFVGSEQEKATAARVAADVTGVKSVVNSLTVAPATSIGTKLDDSVLTGKVKAALMDTADVKSLQINVETHGGVVQLAGFVGSEQMKQRASEVAARVTGVKQVENVLQVRK